MDSAMEMAACPTPPLPEWMSTDSPGPHVAVHEERVVGCGIRYGNGGSLLKAPLFGYFPQDTRVHSHGSRQGLTWHKAHNSAPMVVSAREIHAKEEVRSGEITYEYRK
ncbi:hypothetical protein HPB49_010967 [Dermacentor silvarum]|uniref:Uncharacterized protein n=1 Tax=Dermacentor silvarum TaxID=543639 RepID=A0ACB8D4G8_DERSI|nr:hypothetical protein HPB49_010967 [Dermacentor silvarum]